MSAAFEDIRVDRVKDALTDPAAVAAFESLMEQLDQARNVALVMGTALFEMRGELAAAWKCQTGEGEGEGAVPDGHGDFETCPDCGVDWRARADRAEAALDTLREAWETHVWSLDDAAKNWRGIAEDERSKRSVAIMSGEDGVPSHVISTARAISFEGAAGDARAALSAGSGGRETT